jgi:hypothetical protein
VSYHVCCKENGRDSDLAVEMLPQDAAFIAAARAAVPALIAEVRRLREIEHKYFQAGGIAWKLAERCLENETSDKTVESMLGWALHQLKGGKP